MIPSLPYEVRVPKDHAEQALILIAEAQAAGPTPPKRPNAPAKNQPERRPRSDRA